MSEANDRAIKQSSEDMSGFTPLRTSCPILRSGDEYDRCVGVARTMVPAGFIAVKVVDYEAHIPRWPHGQLVNFYYENDTDPRTTIEGVRVFLDNSAASTAEVRDNDER